MSAPLLRPCLQDALITRVLYQMDGKFATAFKFSRDGLTAAKPRNVSINSGEKIAFLWQKPGRPTRSLYISKKAGPFEDSKKEKEQEQDVKGKAAAKTAVSRWRFSVALQDAAVAAAHAAPGNVTLAKAVVDPDVTKTVFDPFVRFIFFVGVEGALLYKISCKRVRQSLTFTALWQGLDTTCGSVFFNSARPTHRYCGGMR